MSEGPFVGTYGGKSLEESGANPWDLTDQQKKFLSQDHLRYVLAMGLKDAETAARWSNELQAFAEALPYGIPVNISSDPRHGASNAGSEYKSATTEQRNTSAHTARKNTDAEKCSPRSAFDRGEHLKFLSRTSNQYANL